MDDSDQQSGVDDALTSLLLLQKTPPIESMGMRRHHTSRVSCTHSGPRERPVDCPQTSALPPDASHIRRLAHLPLEEAARSAGLSVDEFLASYRQLGIHHPSSRYREQHVNMDEPGKSTGRQKEDSYRRYIRGDGRGDIPLDSKEVVRSKVSEATDTEAPLPSAENTCRENSTSNICDGERPKCRSGIKRCVDGASVADDKSGKKKRRVQRSEQKNEKQKDDAKVSPHSQQTGWVAACSRCGILGKYRPPSEGRPFQHSTGVGAYCGYFRVSPRRGCLQEEKARRRQAARRLRSEGGDTEDSETQGADSGNDKADSNGGSESSPAAWNSGTPPPEYPIHPEYLYPHSFAYRSRQPPHVPVSYYSPYPFETPNWATDAIGIANNIPLFPISHLDIAHRDHLHHAVSQRQTTANNASSVVQNIDYASHAPSSSPYHLHHM
mmetsp:Transcript_6758/g.10174  ORF Transcript_6758/g.10174 Transcript_6758/m.10174 type:complete len:438 (+) Transcript_6758:200-1513(+)|eukprot:CAMPEP_0185030902 /NCGR_PEP_ID=MMETSP1103-20130426/18036_1 /TAXON_ID=36769 /ORGANISM="Paraphysomonas bandaiensis, Strain Caron Lab Isolate" /LENGTH=437 /DNA_ID=CAMNT_0027566205 /DNA_START=164 /DNA_END=1477 /DNA_ORIENTATION=+